MKRLFAALTAFAVGLCVVWYLERSMERWAEELDPCREME